MVSFTQFTEPERISIVEILGYCLVKETRLVCQTLHSLSITCKVEGLRDFGATQGSPFNSFLLLQGTGNIITSCKASCFKWTLALWHNGWNNILLLSLYGIPVWRNSPLSLNWRKKIFAQWFWWSTSVRYQRRSWKRTVYWNSIKTYQSPCQCVGDAKTLIRSIHHYTWTVGVEERKSAGVLDNLIASVLVLNISMISKPDFEQAFEIIGFPKELVG